MSRLKPKPKLFVRDVTKQEDADKLMNDINEYVDSVVGESWLEPKYQFYVSNNIAYVFVSIE